jgi:hypothetical protein
LFDLIFNDIGALCEEFEPEHENEIVHLLFQYTLDVINKNQGEDRLISPALTRTNIKRMI